MLGGDRGLFKIIKGLKFYNNLSRKLKLSLTFKILLYIIDETIKYIVLKNTIEERTLSVIF